MRTVVIGACLGACLRRAYGTGRSMPASLLFILRTGTFSTTDGRRLRQTMKESLVMAYATEGLLEDAPHDG